MKTLEEATEMAGVTQIERGLNLHFSPIPNWYMKCGLACPVCDNELVWDWEWKDKPPAITGNYTPMMCKPILTGGELIAYGHRWLTFECSKCHTRMRAENFD